MREGWITKRLGEICNLYQPKTIPNKEFVEDGLYPVYGSNGIIGRYDKYNHNEREILIACRGTCGKINVSLPFSWINGNAMVVHIQHPDVSFDFLRYQLEGIDMSEAITGATIPQITRQSLSPIRVVIPPASDQLRIVHELDSLYLALHHKEAQLEELKKLEESLFFKMFGDPIRNNKSWPTKKVIEVVKLQRGYDLPVQDRDESGNVPIYGSNGIIGKHTVSKIASGVITGRSGTLGRVYYCKEAFWPLNTTLFSVDCHGNNIVYLKYLLSFYHLERFSAGAGVPTLNRNEFHGESIIDVPLEKQNLFAEQIDIIEKQERIVETSISNMELLIRSRMDYWFK